MVPWGTGTGPLILPRFNPCSSLRRTNRARLRRPEAKARRPGDRRSALSRRRKRCALRRAGPEISARHSEGFLFGFFAIQYPHGRGREHVPRLLTFHSRAGVACPSRSGCPTVAPNSYAADTIATWNVGSGQYRDNFLLTNNLDFDGAGNELQLGLRVVYRTSLTRVPLDESTSTFTALSGTQQDGVVGASGDHPGRNRWNFDYTPSTRASSRPGLAHADDHRPAVNTVTTTAA